jgi:hypothetical protein
MIKTNEMTTITKATELFPASAGHLPAVPRNPSQEFDRLCASLKATLKRIDHLQAAIDREQARTWPDLALIAQLQDHLDKAEDRQARIERRRVRVYRAMVSGSPASKKP